MDFSHFVLILFALIVGSYGYPNTAGSCTGVASPHSAVLSGTGGYTLSVSGNPTSYTPGTSYTITLSGNAIKGLLFYATPQNGGNRVGTYNLGNTGYFDVKPGCAGNTVEHTQTLDNAGPSSVSFAWTAPPAGTGTITFGGQIVRTVNTAYNIGALTLVEAGTPAPPATGTAKTSAGNQQTSANNQQTSDFNYPTSNSASIGGNINTNDANLQQTSGGGGGGLSMGAILGISIGCVLVFLCLVINFVPIIVAKARGDDPKKASTLVGAAYRATRQAFGGDRGDNIKMYR
jgi:hypothetical protein